MLFAAAQIGGIILAVCSPTFWHKADYIIVVHAIFIVGEVIGELLGSVIIYFSKFYCIGSIVVSCLAAENILLTLRKLLSLHKRLNLKRLYRFITRM